MFNPSREEVRAFFRNTLHKQRNGAPLTPIEAIAGDWLALHPEYFDVLAPIREGEPDPVEAREGEANPFLHLSMHLTIVEQVSIDQPAGIRAAVESLTTRLGSAHDAHHEVMECLGEMLWASERHRAPPDGVAYVRCVEHRAKKRMAMRQ